eukprot:6660563-Pyramimonas_sp.AAC.1
MPRAGGWQGGASPPPDALGGGGRPPRPPCRTACSRCALPRAHADNERGRGATESHLEPSAPQSGPRR